MRLAHFCGQIIEILRRLLRRRTLRLRWLLPPRFLLYACIVGQQPRIDGWWMLTPSPLAPARGYGQKNREEEP